jgi:hypothetical protein
MNEHFAIQAPDTIVAIQLLGFAGVCVAFSIFAHFRWTNTRPLAITKLVALMFAALAVRVYWEARHSEVVLTGERIEFRVPAFYSRSIRIEDVDFSELALVDLEREVDWQPKYRTNGLGLWGYRLGRYWVKAKRSAWLAVTDTSKVVVISQRRGPVNLVSLRDPELFIARLAEFEPEEDELSEE